MVQKIQLVLKYVVRIGFFIMMMIAFGCQSSLTNVSNPNTADSQLISQPIRNIPLNTGIVPTESAPIQNITVTSTRQLTESILPTPTAVPIPTIIMMTPTPWPTLEPEMALNKVLSLLMNNNNLDCLLPCWWGVVPGKTSWPEAQAFWSSFAIQTYAFPQDFLNVVVFPITSDISPLEELHIGYIYDQNNTITDIAIPSLNISDYNPSTMLELYGVPDEVWLNTIEAPREGVLPFQLIIVYQQKGISFRYYVDATQTGDNITACFESSIETKRADLFPAGPRIYLWEPSKQKSIQEITSTPLERYFPLENKTELTPQLFYEKFTDPSQLPCINTPADFWSY